MTLPTGSSVLLSIALFSLPIALEAAEEAPPPSETPASAADVLPRAEPVAAKNQPTLATPLPGTQTRPSTNVASKPATVTPLAVTVQLNVGNAELRGTLLSAPEFTVKTSFGELTVPLSEVAGIKLASEGNASTTVIMHNGDSITGAWEFDRIELRTEWGQATIDGAAINSILFAQGMAWVSEKGLSGTRWKLINRPQTQKSQTDEEAAQTAQGLKQGDIIVVARDSDLQTGSEIVGKISKDEVLAIEGVLDAWFYVDNGKVAGWISRENVSAYYDPNSNGSVTRTARAPNR